MVEVSVVIPTYNREDVVGRAIDSALSQTLSDIEVIVVDDASTDETRSVVESYADDRVVLVEHEVNRGGSAARNTGIERATGSYVAFLDSDDEWYERKLSRQVARLEEHDDHWRVAYCGFHTTRTSRFASLVDQYTQRETGIEGDEEVIRALLQLRFTIGGASTLLADRSEVEAIGGFDPSFSRHQDWEFLIRLLRRTKLVFADEVLVRKHHTGAAGYETMRGAKEQYLQKFANEVIDLELNGVPVVPRHRFALAKCAFAEGGFRPGISLLRRSSAPSVRDYLGVVKAVYCGLTRYN